MRILLSPPVTSLVFFASFFSISSLRCSLPSWFSSSDLSQLSFYHPLPFSPPLFLSVQHRASGGYIWITCVDLCLRKCVGITIFIASFCVLFVKGFDCVHNIEGGGWVLVRRVQAGRRWHPSNDNLRGWDTYGTYGEGTFSATFFALTSADTEVLFTNGMLLLNTWLHHSHCPTHTPLYRRRLLEVLAKHASRSYKRLEYL